MNSKFSFKRHFQTGSFAYIILFLLAAIIFPYFINAKLSPKDFETFSVFIADNDVNKKGLQEYFESVLGEEIIRYNIYYSSPTSSLYSQSYTTQGFSSDIMILPKSHVIEDDMKFYLEIPSKYVSSSSYVIDDKCVGIEVFNGSEGVLTEYISYEDEKYYLFINEDSIHLEGLKDKNNKSDNVNRLLGGLFNV